MKILFVVHQFLPKHVAGAELYTYHLAKRLQGRGHDVTIYTREFGHLEQPLREEDTSYDGIRVKRVYLPALGGRLASVRGLARDCHNPLVFGHFHHQLHEIKPDIVHIQHLMGLSGSLINAVRHHQLPLVVTLHDYWFMCPTVQLLTPALGRCSGPLSGVKCARCLVPARHPVSGWALYPVHAALSMVRTWYLRRLLSKADSIIAPSEFLRDRFVEHGVPRNKISYSDYGMETESLPPSRPQSQATGKGKLRFAFIGSVMRHKGVHVLIDAFNRLPGARAELRIYGDPNYAPDYYASLRGQTTNGAVRFMGSFQNNEIYRILAETDVLVVPSVWYENSPLTMHEAVLAGVPVIASNIGGMAELVTKTENGLLFEVGNPDDLYEKMAHLVEAPHRLEGLRGRLAEVKGMEDDAAAFETLYGELRAQRRQQ